MVFAICDCSTNTAKQYKNLPQAAEPWRSQSAIARLNSPQANITPPIENTACIKSGVDIKTLQDNLGHSDVQTTLNIYSHVFDSMKEASAHQVEAYYSELKKEK